jgi:hypothetical protein
LEDLTPEQRAEWEARHRSWEAGQRALRDPVVRAGLERALRRLDDEPQSPAISPEEFLAMTAPLTE